MNEQSNWEGGVLGVRKILINRIGIEEGHKAPYDKKIARRQEMITVTEVGIPEGVTRAEGRVEAAGWGDGGSGGGESWKTFDA